MVIANARTLLDAGRAACAPCGGRRLTVLDLAAVSESIRRP
jgi:hypothetical protein